MQNLGISKLIAGVVVLVVLAGIVLRISNRGERNPGQPAVAETATSQARSSGIRHVRSSEAAAPVLDTQELATVDFDWRQTLTNQVVPPKLPREEVEKYLERNNRNAVSLLAACRALGDTNYLVEAATNFPNDPRVQLGVLARGVFPEDRRKWLDLFNASSPDNSLANYLSARDYFSSGQSGLAVNELVEAAGKAGFKDYAMESKLDEEELNMAAGRSSLQARLSSSGWAQDLLPELSSSKALAQDLASLQKQYLSAGDAGSAERLAQIGLALANRFDTGDGTKFAIKQLVGIAMENIILSPLDPSAGYDFLGGETPNARLAELKQQRDSLRALRQTFQDAAPNMTEAELLSYTERQRLYGEMEAMRWLQQRRSATSAPQSSQ